MKTGSCSLEETGSDLKDRSHLQYFLCSAVFIEESCYKCLNIGQILTNKTNKKRIRPDPESTCDKNITQIQYIFKRPCSIFYRIYKIEMDLKLLFITIQIIDLNITSKCIFQFINNLHFYTRCVRTY